MSETLTPAERAQAAGEFVEALAVATRPKTLMAREEYLQALLDSEGGVPQELEEAFRDDIQRALFEAKSKRDAVAAYLLKLVTEAAKVEAEILISKQNTARLTARKARYENAAERLRDYVLGVIREIGPDTKGKLKSLEGDTCTLQAKRVPPSVDIVDATKIPLEYCGIEVKFSASQYAAIRQWIKASRESGCGPTEAEKVIGEALHVGTLVPSKVLIGQTLKHSCPQCTEDVHGVHEACAVCGGTGFERVPGATLRRDALRLVVS